MLNNALLSTVGAILFFAAGVCTPCLAQQTAALSGTVSSAEEGAMEGVVITAKKPGSIVSVSVTSDARGHFAIPKGRLEPGQYNLTIRAVGYENSAPAKADVSADGGANVELKLKKSRNLSAQLTNAEWLMSIPGTVEQKDFLSDCTGCHTMERIVRSTHDADEWQDTIVRMKGYAPVSQTIKPQRMLDPSRSGTREQWRKAAEYLATINLSATDHWEYPLKTMPRPAGDATRVIVTEYQLPRPTIEPHDVILDKDGVVWYSNFGEMFIGKFDTKTLNHTEYPVKQYKPDAPVGILNIDFDRNGDLWFDSMYQGALGKLDPKSGQMTMYPVPDEYNDIRAQLNFVGLRHEVDGKVCTKDVGTNNVLRLDLATNKWEKFRPTDKLAGAGPYGIYQLISDSKNNAWVAEFGDGHLGRVDAKTGDVKWFNTPTQHARARRMSIDDRDNIMLTLYRSNSVTYFDTKTEQFTEYKLPTPYTYPYRAAADKNGDIWVSTMSTDRVVRFHPNTGKSSEYLMPTETNMRSAYVDNTTAIPTFWVGSNHTASLVKVEPLD
jgi:virginiamycin B lyase